MRRRTAVAVLAAAVVGAGVGAPAAGGTPAGAAGSQVGGTEDVVALRFPAYADGSPGHEYLRTAATPGGSITAVTGTQTPGGPVQAFVSRVADVGGSADPSRTVAITISARLGVGTWRTARNGSAPVVLDWAEGSNGCGGELPGTLHVLEARYDDAGAPLAFAADFTVSCWGSVAAGAVRWHSAVPFGGVESSVPAQVGPVVVGRATSATTTYTARGNAPVTLGQVALHQDPTGGRSAWSVTSDGCSHTWLQPGASCAVVMRFAPLVIVGNPAGSPDARLSVPDGWSPYPAHAVLHGAATALPDQPVGLAVEGAYRHLVLTWMSPMVWSQPKTRYDQIDYRVYQVQPNGSRRLVVDGLTDRRAVVPRLPAGYRGTYEVTAEHLGTEGPPSVTETGTVATSELVHVETGRGQLLDQQLTPVPGRAAAYGTADVVLPTTDAYRLAASADGGRLAYSWRNTWSGGVVTLRSDGSAGVWGTDRQDPGTSEDPALSRDGATLVYGYRAESSKPDSVLRSVDLAHAGQAALVPGSEGLSDPAVTPDGAAVVAVRATADGTELVRLPLAGGTPQVVPGGDGAGEPDVGPDGRVVAVVHPDPTWPASAAVVVIDPRTGDGAPVAAAGVAAGERTASTHPLWTRDGRGVLFRRADVSLGGPGFGDAWVADLAAGTSRALTSTPLEDDDTAVLLEDAPAPAPDRAAPRVRLTAPAATTTLARRVHVAWSATDPSLTGAVTSGVTSYDVRTRTTTPTRRSARLSSPAGLQRTARTSADLPLPTGATTCFSVRARDRAGNASAWSPERCTTTPDDDRALTARGAARRRDRAAWNETATVAARRGATLTLAGVRGSRVAVLVTTCRACGSVDVRLGGRHLGTVSLQSAATHRRVLRWLPVRPAAGTLLLRTTNTHRVAVDGVVVLP